MPLVKGVKISVKHCKEDGMQQKEERLTCQYVNHDVWSEPNHHDARELMGTQPEPQSLTDQVFLADPEPLNEEMGMGLSDDRATRTGQVVGHSWC